MNRRVRGPYARWCERAEVGKLLTSPYSIIRIFYFLCALEAPPHCLSNYFLFFSLTSALLAFRLFKTLSPFFVRKIYQTYHAYYICVFKVCQGVDAA